MLLLFHFIWFVLFPLNQTRTIQQVRNFQRKRNLIVEKYRAFKNIEKNFHGNFSFQIFSVLSQKKKLTNIIKYENH